MSIGDKVFVDKYFKMGYVYSYDKLSDIFKIAIVENEHLSFINVKKELLSKF